MQSTFVCFYSNVESTQCGNSQGRVTSVSAPFLKFVGDLWTQSCLSTILYQPNRNADRFSACCRKNVSRRRFLCGKKKFNLSPQKVSSRADCWPFLGVRLLLRVSRFQQSDACLCGDSRMQKRERCSSTGETNRFLFSEAQQRRLSAGTFHPPALISESQLAKIS